MEHTSQQKEDLLTTLEEQYTAGLDALGHGDLDGAIKYLNLARALDKDRLDICFNLGLAYYQKEDWPAALALLRACIEPAFPNGEALYFQGMCLLQVHESQNALDAFEAAARTGNLEAHYQLSLLYKAGGRRKNENRKKSVKHLEAIVNALAEGAEFASKDRAFFALGQIYAERDETHDKAILLFRKGLEVNPFSSLGHNSLGVLLLARGQILGAGGEFKVAIQLDAALPGPYTHLANVFYYHINPADLAQEYAHIIEEFGTIAAAVLARLSQEMAELSRDQVYQGLYTKGHQLKNLMGIMGSRLRRQAGKVERGEVSTEEMRELVQGYEHLYEEWVGYLTSLQPEALEPTRTDSVKLVQRVIEALKSHAGEKRFTLRKQAGIPPIEVDERLIREVITNLCLNARDVVDPLQGEVSVGVGYDIKKSRVFIEVEDNGPGISPDILEHIFEPGFTTKEQGNGYGLSIARRIIQAHRGELRVKSRLKHGTVFRVDLPVNFETIEDPLAKSEQLNSLNKGRRNGQ